MHWLFKFNGTINRQKFAIGQLIIFLAIIAGYYLWFTLVSYLFAGELVVSKIVNYKLSFSELKLLILIMTYTSPLLFILFVVICWTEVSLLIQRLNDIQLPAWFACLPFLLVFIFLSISIQGITYIAFRQDFIAYYLAPRFALFLFASFYLIMFVWPSKVTTLTPD